MDLADLNIFLTVLRTGGVTRAATQLHRVQSNITTRVQQLEENLGVALFIREGRRMIPSPAAQVLAGYAERLLNLADEARAAVSDRAPRGRLRLGSMESTAAVRLPPRLADFHGRHPGVRLELRTGPTGQLIAEVLDGTLDCALVSGPVADPRLSALPVFEEELVLVAAANHPPIADARDVRTRTLLAFEPSCAYRQRLEQWLAVSAPVAVVPEQVVELSSYHAMLGCAAAGMGIALAPRSLLASLPSGSSVSTHPLPPPLGQSTTVLIRRAGIPHPAAEAMAEALLAPAGA